VPFLRDRPGKKGMKTIKDMPEHSRPREKLREKGASAMLGMGDGVGPNLPFCHPPTLPS